MKNKKRRLKRWVKYTLVIIIITLVSIPVIKLLQNMSKDDKEAYNNCVKNTGNETYCTRVVYGIY